MSFRIFLASALSIIVSIFLSQSTHPFKVIKDAMPNSRFMKLVDRKFIRPYERGEILRIVALTNKDFKSRNSILTSSLLHKRFRVDLVLAISIGQRGGAAAGATEAPLRRPSRTVTCPRLRATHQCGGPGSIPDF